MVNKKFNFYFKNQTKMQSILSDKRKKLLNFLSFQASTAFYNNFYNFFFNLYLYRLINKYEKSYQINSNSILLGSMHSRHHMIAYNNLSSNVLTRMPFQRRNIQYSSNHLQNIQFFYFNNFLNIKNKTLFRANVNESEKLKISFEYSKTTFDRHYDRSLIYFSWADFFSPGLFNYSPTRFWFLFVYTPSFIKYKSNWLTNSLDDLYLIYFFSKIFTLRLHKTIPSFLITDLKLIVYEMKNNLKLTEERDELYIKSLESIFEGLTFFSSVELYSREELLFFQGSWLDCLHVELYEETSKWIMPIKEEIDWTVFQGDLDDWWESLFYIFLSESYIWPFVDYSEEDFILHWKKKIMQQTIDETNFFFIDYSTSYLQATPDSFFHRIGTKLVDKIWMDFINGNLYYTERTKHSFQLIGKIFLILNTWVLSGLAGRDRRVLFYRFVYLLILKLRGFFFYWYMILLKPITFKLPWHREVQYIETLFSTNQTHYKNKIMISLRKDYTTHLLFFSKPFAFAYFWAFFSKHIFKRLVIQKRNQIEPDFFVKLERLLLRKPKWAYLYTNKITKLVYIALFWDFFYYKWYYWYLIVICFSAWWDVFKNKKEYYNKVIVFFFEEDQKFYNLNKQGRHVVLKKMAQQSFYQKNTLSFSTQQIKYANLKLNLFFSLLLYVKRLERHELNLYWYLPDFTYKLLFQRAVNYLKILILTLFKNIINLFVSLFYESIVDFNIGRVARMAAQNQAQMWFQTKNPEFIISGIRQQVLFNKTNKEQTKYTQSLITMFVLFVIKLDSINWSFLVQLFFYYYPLKWMYTFIVFINKCISNICYFYFFLYVLVTNLIIEIKCAIKVYHEPKLRSELIKHKNREQWRLHTKLKSKKTLTKIINFNVHSISFFNKIHLHLQEAKEEYIKAKQSLNDFPQLFPFLLTGETKPNNYMLYVTLFTYCSQFLTTILIVIGFCLHWFLWIFRKNWNKWFFLYFFLQFFIFSMVTVSFFIFLILFFLSKKLYINQIHKFVLIWCNKYSFFFYKVCIFLYNWIEVNIKIFYKKFLYLFNIINVQNLLIYKNYFSYILFAVFLNGINLGLTNKNLRSLTKNIINFLETLHFAFNDLILYSLYSILVVWYKSSHILYWFWQSFLLFIIILICGGYMLYDLYLSIYNIWYKKDAHDFIYFRAIFSFVRSEFKESVISIKELIFIGSLGLRFMLMFLGFFLYLIYQIGWRFRIYSSSKDKIKKLWTVPTKHRVLRFLDKWVLYFFYRVRQFFFFDLISFVIFYIYWFWIMFIFGIGKFIYLLYFSLLFIKYFLQIEMPKVYNFFYKKKIIYTNFKQKNNKYYLYIMFIIFKINDYIQYKFFFYYNLIYNWWHGKKNINILILWTLQFIYIMQNIFLYCINKASNSKKLKNNYILLNLKFNIRDFQELLVFINKNYNFIAFYWSTVLQISIDYGDFGWWLPYSGVTVRSSLSKMVDKWRVLSLRDFKNHKLKRKQYMYKLDEKRYHNKHAYYFSLNKITKPLLRKKAFLNDYIFHTAENKLNKKFSWFFLLLSKLYNWFGLSFFFEVLYQRFKTPISIFFFSINDSYNKNNNLFLLTRLQKIKDTFSHLQWHLSVLRENTNILVLDEFGINIWKYISKKYYSQSFFFKPKITFSFYPLTTKHNKALNSLFKHKRYINIKALLNLFKYLLSFFFYFFFLLCLINFFFIISVFCVFLFSWRITYFCFNMINFYVNLKFNKFSFFLILLFIFFFLFLF